MDCHSGHNAGTSLHRNSTVDRARWVGALSFYKQLSSAMVLETMQVAFTLIKLFKCNQSTVKCQSIL